MTDFNNYKYINYNNNDYAVCDIYYNDVIVPVVMDFDIFVKIKKLNKNWHINDKGIVTTMHKITENNKNISKEIYLHDLILKLSNDNKNQPILHINKIGIDNRKCNLMYDDCEKHITKNLIKKKRIIKLPKKCGINPNDLPSFVWYVKEDSSHGDRFIINIGDIKWKSTSSTKVSLKYKLEETKKYLRYLRNIRKDLFNDYSMNGDLNNDGKKLIDSFIEISKEAGFKNLKNNTNDNTKNYLEENTNGLTQEEKTFLIMFDPSQERINFKNIS